MDNIIGSVQTERCGQAGRKYGVDGIISVEAADDGAMRTYWQEIDGKYYWFGADGVMRTGWQEVWGKWYYLWQSG